MLTPSQTEAVGSLGNVLVVAGAGAGKTSTLTRRCLHWLLHSNPRSSLKRMALLTFTEAAASEMRHRLRLELGVLLQENPEDLFLREQLLLLDASPISTLHSFCLNLVREHFFLLQIDPEFRVFSEGERAVLMDELLIAMLEESYASDSDEASQVKELVRLYGNGSDIPVKELIMGLFEFSQSLPDPEKWLDGQYQLFSPGFPEEWERWFLEALNLLVQNGTGLLQRQPADNPAASKCLKFLRDWKPVSRPEAGEDLRELCDFAEQIPHGSREKFLKPLKSFFDQAKFLRALCPGGSGTDPLREDWALIQPHMRTLVRMCLEFRERFAKAKRGRAALDFQDLEQFSLRLLVDLEGRTTPLAWRLQQRLDFLFVDEYQDINQAQDAIIQALSRTGSEKNRFLVGDVKQSIYGFRLANPKIFLHYEEEWKSAPESRVVYLNENFRSRELILCFVNSFFCQMMTPALGGVAYEGTSEIDFGNPSGRHFFSAATEQLPRVHLHLQETKKAVLVGDEAGREESLGSLEQELELLADLILKTRKDQLIQESDGSRRPVDWGDMVILLRSPASRISIFNQVFSARSIPLVSGHDYFLKSREVQDLISVLRVLDNPCQDIPLLAVLRSGFFMFSDELLVRIRMALNPGPIWHACMKFSRSAADACDRAAVVSMIEKVGHWRLLRSQLRMENLLQRLLHESGYLMTVETMSRPAERTANIKQFIGMARDFEASNRPGVYWFLRYIEAQEELPPAREPLKASRAEGVRLMSIHQSKGLEFPIVFLANLGKRFNMDHRDALFIDSRHGLCPKVFPPGSLPSYPSLVRHLGTINKRKEILSEEMRLLYVGMTRAVHDLFLVGSISSVDSFGSEPKMPETAGSVMNWMEHWLKVRSETTAGTLLGGSKELEIVVHEPRDRPSAVDPGVSSGPAVFERAELEVLERLHRKLEFHYPQIAATRQAAKASVSSLRKEMAWMREEESMSTFRTPVAKKDKSPTELGPMEVGTAHHLFLEHLQLRPDMTQNHLELETARLMSTGILNAGQAGVLNLDSLVHFWQMEEGRLMASQPGLVRREIPFTCRFHMEEIAGMGLIPPDGVLDDWLVIQGAVDLLFMDPRGAWIIDFKTDRLNPVNQPELSYQSQIQLYARAMEKIHGKKVKKAALYMIEARKFLPVELPIN